MLYSLDGGSVPIYMGTWDVDRFLPGMQDGIVNVKDFPTPEHLGEYIKLVAANEALYNTYLAWKGRGVVDYSGTDMAAVADNMQNWLCNICDRVREDPKPHRGRVKGDKCKHRIMGDWFPTPRKPTTAGTPASD